LASFNHQRAGLASPDNLNAFPSWFLRAVLDARRLSDVRHGTADRCPTYSPHINGEPLPKHGADPMKNETPTLSDVELDAVTGGKDSTLRMSLWTSLVTSLAQMQHDTLKAVIQNLRA